jgi:hypothetical protein
MPIRNQAEGRITPSRAALYSAEVANAVVDPLLESRASWNNQGVVFCAQLRDEMEAMFKKLHPKLGATVSRL